MGYLFHILLAFGGVAAAESGLVTGLEIWWATAFLLPLPHLVGRWMRAVSLRGGFRRANLGARFLSIAPPALAAVSLCVFGWNAAVTEWFGGLEENDWPTPALLGAFVPFLVFEFLTIDARSRLHDNRPAEIARLRRFHVRMFLSGVVPLGVYLAIVGTAGVNETVRAHIEEVGLFHAAFATVSVIVFVAFLPAILRNTWETVPLDRGPERAVLDAVASHADFRCREMRVWRTGHLMANAAIVGFLPQHRVVLFSDSLLAQLGPRELAGVFAHEIGHAKRGHVYVFSAWTVAFVMGASILVGELSSESPWLVGALSLALLGCWYVGFGYLSRRFELDADLVGYEVTGDAEALVRALEQVGGAHGRTESGWRHFSTAQRVIFLRALAREAGVGERLRRSLTAWTRLGYAAFAITAAVQLWILAASWSDDLVAVDLRLGDYGSALARLETTESDTSDDTFLEIVRRAAELAGNDGELSAHELGDEARAALTGGEVRPSLLWLELGARRRIEPHHDLWMRLHEHLDETDDDAEASFLRELATEI